MTKKPASDAIKRILSSLAAIAAVSAIFGAKAYEIEHRDAPSKLAQTAAVASPETHAD